MITATDDYSYPAGPQINFGQSIYFQFHDSRRNISGFLRVVNRSDEGCREYTVCLYLPDGGLAYGCERARTTASDGSAALAINVIRPLRQARVTFVGVLHVVTDTRDMIDPKSAVLAGRQVPCRMSLCGIAAAPPYEQTSTTGDSYVAAHRYEQLISVSGQICIGAETIAIRGYGLGHHSWGPTSSQAPAFFRWLHGSTGDFGFAVWYFGGSDQASRRGGFVFEGGKLHACDEVEIFTIRDTEGYQDSITVEVGTAGRHWQLRGEAIASVPDRGRGQCGFPDARVVQSAMRWCTGTGMRFYGMAEYLDQLADGQPVGMEL